MVWLPYLEVFAVNLVCEIEKVDIYIGSQPRFYPTEKSVTICARYPLL
jgi:hypothetical protein